MNGVAQRHTAVVWQVHIVYIHSDLVWKWFRFKFTRSALLSTFFVRRNLSWPPIRLRYLFKQSSLFPLRRGPFFFSLILGYFHQDFLTIRGRVPNLEKVTPHETLRLKWYKKKNYFSFHRCWQVQINIPFQAQINFCFYSTHQKKKMCIWVLKLT